MDKNKPLILKKRQPFLTKYGFAKVKGLIPLFLIVIGLISIVYSVTLSTDTFFEQTNPYNITFDQADGGNQTDYLVIDKNSYVRNVSVQITGNRFVINYSGGTPWKINL